MAQLSHVSYPEATRQDQAVETRNKVSSAAWIQSLSLVILLVSGLIFVLNVYKLQNQLLDDAYITFRYAQHLAQGQGLIWNVGGPRTEGYTSLLHVILLALAIKLNLSLELSSLFISAVSVIATVTLIALVLRRQFRLLYPTAAVILGIYLIDPTTSTLAANGLETQLFVAILCAGYVLALAFLESPRLKTGMWMAITTFLSVLVRPEAVLYGGAFYLVLGIYFAFFAQKGFALSKELKSLLASAGLLLGIGAVYAAWKYWYFGYLLPNTFYVKSDSLGLDGLSYVARYVKFVFLAYGPVIFGFTFFVPGEAYFVPFRKAREAAKILLTLAPPFIALSYYLTITHEVGGAHRFSYPTLFFFVVAIAVFVSIATRSFSPFSDRWPRFFVAVGASFLVLLTYQDAWKTLQYPVQVLPVPAFNQYHLKIADALQSTGLGSKASVLTDAAGIIPYVSGFNQVDRVGLTDNFMSGRSHPTLQEREQYLWTRKVDVYIGYEPQASPGNLDAQDDPVMQTPYVKNILIGRQLTLIENRIFVQDPTLLHNRMQVLRDQYYLVGEIDWPGYQAWGLKSFAYVRKDSQYFDTLVSALHKIIYIEPAQINLDN